MRQLRDGFAAGRCVDLVGRPDLVSVLHAGRAGATSPLPYSRHGLTGVSRRPDQSSSGSVKGSVGEVRSAIPCLKCRRHTET